MPEITHDPDALWSARYELRRSQEVIKRLRQADPTIATLIVGLEDMITDLTTELDTIEPTLPLAVRHPVLVAPGIERRITP